MCLAMLIGMAKQMPCAGWITAVLMPMTWPRLSTSGPPLLPGFRAASVWMTLSTRWPVMLRSVRPSALITPAVTVDSTRQLLAIGQANADTAVAMDHVMVRQQETVGREENAGARSVSPAAVA